MVYHSLSLPQGYVRLVCREATKVLISKESTWRALQILQLMHVDICGPIKPISNGKKRYLITFTNDFSRKTWVYFLIEKSEALAVLRVLRYMLRRRQTRSLECYVLIEEESLHHKSSSIFVM